MFKLVNTLVYYWHQRSKGSIALVFIFMYELYPLGHTDCTRQNVDTFIVELFQEEANHL